MSPPIPLWSGTRRVRWFGERTNEGTDPERSPGRGRSSGLSCRLSGRDLSPAPSTRSHPRRPSPLPLLLLLLVPPPLYTSPLRLPDGLHLPSAQRPVGGLPALRRDLVASPQVPL